MQYQNLRIRDIINQNTINVEFKKEYCIFKEIRKDLTPTWKQRRSADATIRQRPLQMLRFGHDAAPPTCQCATELCSRFASNTMPRRRSVDAPHLNSTWTRSRTDDAAIIYSLPQPLRLGHYATPPNSQFATYCLSHCASYRIPRC